MTSLLKRAGIVGEVLIADNGSTDGSQLIAESNGANVVAIPERGYGAALIGGISAARGRYVIMGDADDSYDFESLDAYRAWIVRRVAGGTIARHPHRTGTRRTGSATHPATSARSPPATRQNTRWFRFYRGANAEPCPCGGARHRRRMD